MNYMMKAMVPKRIKLIMKALHYIMGPPTQLMTQSEKAARQIVVVVVVAVVVAVVVITVTVGKLTTFEIFRFWKFCIFGFSPNSCSITDEGSNRG